VLSRFPLKCDQFYDDVLELTEFEKEQIKAMGFDEEKLKNR
jgi:hypothetical protein